MSVPKWNSNEIAKFLEIYETYEILWNIRLYDYSNKNKRESAFQKLMKELRDDGFQDITLEILRKKIKTIKTVYRQELAKVQKSKRSGAGTEDLYKPKLSWYKKADSFLNNVTAMRPSSSTLDTSKMRMTPDIQKQVLNSTNNEQNLPNGGETVAQEHESSFISSGDEQQYCLKWKFHQNNQQAMFAKLLKKESFCDVTIACEEKLLRAHKLVLSACSSYFEMILSFYEDQNPVIILKDVKFDDMSALIQFMYKGEISIEQGQLQSLLETADFLKIKGLSDIYGQCLGVPSESSGTENSAGEPQYTKMEEQSDDGQSLDPSKIGQLRRKTVSTPEDGVHRPVKIPRRNIGVEVAQDGIGVATQPLPSHHENHANKADYMEGIISLPDFLKGHGTYQEFWKKPWVIRALKAVSDREITLRNCSDLLGVGYSILYNRYRQLHGCLKDGSIESHGTSHSYTLKIVRTANENEQGGEIILRRDQLSPAAAFSVAHQSENSSGREAVTEPILNVKLEPVTSVNEMYECEAMEYDRKMLQDPEES